MLRPHRASSRLQKHHPKTTFCGTGLSHRFFPEAQPDAPTVRSAHHQNAARPRTSGSRLIYQNCVLSSFNCNERNYRECLSSGIVANARPRQQSCGVWAFWSMFGGSRRKPSGLVHRNNAVGCRKLLGKTCQYFDELREDATGLRPAVVKHLNTLSHAVVNAVSI
jgi:hypothetical protein